MNEPDDDSRWDRCLLTTGCVHRHGHGGGCLPVWEIAFPSTEAVYVIAIKAGLDMIEELTQHERTRT